MTEAPGRLAAAPAWRVVLVRPRNPLNIGAAARAMANFGLRDLVVAASYAAAWQEARSAVGAEDVLKSARAVDHLAQAIADCTLVVGTTSGSRRILDRELVPLSDLPRWITADDAARAGKSRRAHQAAILFGSEKTGLSNEEMRYCHALVRIPTVPACPSMNLGQAVAVCCYHLAAARAIRARPPSHRVYLSAIAPSEALEHVLERAARLLVEAGYIKLQSRQASLLRLRRFLLSRNFTNSDVKILGGVLAQLEWKLGISE